MYAMLGIGAALVLSLGANVWQQGRIDNLNQAVGGYVINETTLKGEITNLNIEIKDYVATVAKQSVQLSYESDRANKANAARDEELARLNSWRDRLKNEIQDRPVVAARAAGMATRRVFNALRAATEPSGSSKNRDSSTDVSPSETSTTNPSDN